MPTSKSYRPQHTDRAIRCAVKFWPRCFIKTIGTQSNLSLTAAAVLFALGTDCAHSGIKSYRYKLLSRSGDLVYRGEVATSKHHGPRYDVRTDKSGRIVRAVTYQDGRKIHEIAYQFSGEEKLPNGYREFRRGKQTGAGRIQRYEDGTRKEEEFLTMKGSVTSYCRYHYYPDNRVEVSTYTADSIETKKHTYYFSNEGMLIRLVDSPPASDVSLDTTFDESTGQKQSEKQFNKDKLAQTHMYTYDTDDNLVGVDHYDSYGRPYGTTDFAAGLPVKRTYRFRDGSTKEVQFTYDDKREAKEVKIYYNEKYICSLTYDRLSDGDVKRTLAKGPDGKLWAEYPNIEVPEVRQNGRSVNGQNGVIYKKGLWW